MGWKIINLNVEQGSKEHRGNIEGAKKKKNLKPDISRHWGFCHFRGNCNLNNRVRILTTDMVRRNRRG